MRKLRRRARGRSPGSSSSHVLRFRCRECGGLYKVTTLGDVAAGVEALRIRMQFAECPECGACDFEEEPSA